MTTTKTITTTRRRRPRRWAVAACGLTAAAVSAGAIAIASSTGASAGSTRTACEREFDDAQRIDMESFRDYDADTFREGHHPDAVTIFPGGQVFIGVEATMDALASHFEDREAIWAWTELDRVVVGCKTAHITYEATYEIPSIDYFHRAIVGVTYTRLHGTWLAVADQNTLLPAEE